MFSLKAICVFGLIGLAVTAPQGGYKYGPGNQGGAQSYSGSRNNVPITSYNNDINFDGSFKYSYSTGDGQAAQASGYLKNAGQKDLEAQVIQGSYSYTSPEGQPISLTYIADENGFRAEGAHLPTSPPIPEAIAKSLQLIAKTQGQPQFNQNQFSGGQRGGYNNKFQGY